MWQQGPEAEVVYESKQAEIEMGCKCTIKLHVVMSAIWHI